MLQTIREQATGWIAYIIIGLIVLTFALWGIGSYFSEPAMQEVAEVNGKPISQRQFQGFLSQQRQRLPGVDLSSLRPLFLEQLINQELILQAAQQGGVQIGNQQLRDYILNQAAFQSNGQFDKTRYQQILRAQGMTEASFEQNLRIDLMGQTLAVGIDGSAFVTQAAREQAAALLFQQRDLAYIPLNAQSVTIDEQVTDEQLTAFYQTHQDQFRRPAQVRVQYLELGLEQLAKQVSVTNEQLQAEYQQQKANFLQAANRDITMLLAKTSDDAQKAQHQADALQFLLAQGKPFAELVKFVKDTPNLELIEEQDITANFYEQANLNQAIAGLQKVGDISPVIKTAFGYHVIRLDAIHQAKTKPFDEVKEDLAKAYRLKQAENQLFEEHQQLVDALYDNPQSLEPAARASGLTVDVSDWFSQSEQKNNQGIAQLPAVVAAAFSSDVYEQDLNSNLLEISPTRFIALRLMEKRPSAIQAIADIKPQVKEAILAQRRQAALEKAVDAVQNRWQANEPLDQLTKRYNTQVKQLGLVNRQNRQAPSALVEAAFALPLAVNSKQSVFGQIALSDNETAVFRVRDDKLADWQSLTKQQQQQVNQQLVMETRRGVLQAFVEALRGQADIQVNADQP